MTEAADQRTEASETTSKADTVDETAASAARAMIGDPGDISEKDIQRYGVDKPRRRTIRGRILRDKA